MNAVISGTAGQALLIDGESLRSIDVEDLSNLVVRRQADLPYLFGEGRDLRFIENTDLDSIVKELKSESDLSLALDLTLISLDEELEEDISRDALRDLDELLVGEELQKNLEGIVYARPLPDDADMKRILACFRGDPRFSKVFAFVDNLSRRQPLISKVSEAWDVIPTKLFGDSNEKNGFQRVAVRQGLFRSLVINLELPGTVSRFLLSAGLNQTVRALPNSRRVLQVWSAPFREVRETPMIELEADDGFETEILPKRRRGRRVGVDRQRLLREVNHRKASISAAMHRRDLTQVRELVGDLVNFQRGSGETEHLAKSLCDLASEAQELGLFSLQLELTEKSIIEAPDDAWSWVQYCQSLVNVNRFDEALRACEQADAFGAGLVAKIGRAEILKKLGRYLEALAAYDLAIEEDPSNDASLNGRADVLTALGYTSIVNHPDSLVARMGRVEVLRLSGHLGEALGTCEDIIREFPENIVARVSRADILKTMRKFEAALIAYDEVIQEHPEVVVARNGRAEVLREFGHFQEALEAFTATISLYPEDIVAKVGRAETLRAFGLLQEALKAYEQIRRESPGDVNARIGRAETLKQMGRVSYVSMDQVSPSSLGISDKTLAAHEAAVTYYSCDILAKNGLAETLKELGRLNEALAVYALN